MEYIDLTQSWRAPMPVYPRDPRPKLTQLKTWKTHWYSDHGLTTTMHVGTHIDAPLHVFPKGKKLSDYPIEKFIGRGQMIDVRGQALIQTDCVKDLHRGDSEILLVCTGWDKKYRSTDYYKGFPLMTESFARAVIDAGFNIVGLDSPSPDESPFLIHQMLLKHDVLIIENLTNLNMLAGHDNFTVMALPPPWPTDGAPARVIASIQEQTNE